MRIRLDRTLCDGFGICAKHAPAYFSLDDWGYASLVGNGAVPDTDRPAVTRALLDCPVHAIIEMADDTTAGNDRTPLPSSDVSHSSPTIDDHDAPTDEPLREAQMMPGM